MKKIISLFKLITLTGILIILGTAGASDLGRLNIADAFSQILLGTVLIITGKIGLTAVKTRREALRRKIKRNRVSAIRQTKAA